MSIEALKKVSEEDSYNAERGEKIISLSLTQKLECAGELISRAKSRIEEGKKPFFTETELNDVLYESDLTLKDLEDIAG